MIVGVSELFDARNASANQRTPITAEQLGASPILAHVFHWRWSNCRRERGLSMLCIPGGSRDKGQIRVQFPEACLFRDGISVAGGGGLAQ